LAYCIDKTSGREAVYDPEIEESIMQSVQEYKFKSRLSFAVRETTQEEWTDWVESLRYLKDSGALTVVDENEDEKKRWRLERTAQDEALEHLERWMADERTRDFMGNRGELSPLLRWSD
jgi:hypothetical protein